MLSALIATAAVLPIPQDPAQVQIPKRPDLVQFTPFPDGPQDTAAAGSADFDGDGNRDLWFLAGAGPGTGQLSVQMGNTSHLGSYRDWRNYPPDAWTDAATFHSETYAQDRILIADPAQGGLSTVLLQLAVSGDPRYGQWFTTPNFWLFDTGIFEIETRDDSGDGHDDVVVMIDRGATGTTVKKLVIDDEGFGPQVQSTVAVEIPAELETLRLLDLDGDGRTDFAAVVPGAGLLVFRDDGAQGFELMLALPTAIPIRGLFADDLLGGGRDALGVCIDDGVLLGCFTPAGLLGHWLPRPAGSGALAAAELLPNQENPRVVAVPRDGQSLLVYPFLSTAQVFTPPIHAVPEDPSLFAGPGALGLGAFGADVDGDGDRDILLQMASGESWVTVTNTVRSLQLSAMNLTDLGLVGETGFRRQLFSFSLPDDWDPQEIPNAEAAVYLQDVTTGYTSYWGRLTPEVDGVSRTVSFVVYTQVDPLKLPAMHANPQPYQFPDGITAGGDSAISLHGLAGSRRFETIHLFHEPSGGGSGSGSGASWTMTAAPPLPTTESEMLPWGG